MPASDAASATIHDPKRLVHDTILNHLGLVVPAAVNLLLLPWIIRLAGREVYGFWVAILAMTTVFASFDLGMASAVTRAVAEARVSASEVRGSQQFVRSAFLVTLAMAALIALNVGFGAIALSGPLHFRIPAALPLTAVFAGVGIFAQQIIAFVTWILNGASRFGITNGMNAGLSISRAVGSLAVLYAGYGLVGLAAWYAATGSAGALAGVVIVSRGSGGYRLYVPAFDWAAVKQRVPFSLGSQAFHLLSSIMSDTAPVLIIGSVLGTGAIVTYHLGQRVAITAFQIFAAAGSVLYTMACEAAHDLKRMAGVVRIGTRWMALLVAPVSIILLIVAPLVLQAWLGSVDQQTLLVLRIAVVGVAATAMGEAFLYAVWMSSTAAVVSVYGVLIPPSVIGSWALVKTFLTPGAAAAITLTSIALTTSFSLLAVRRYRFSIVDVIREAIAGLPLAVFIAAATTAAGLFLPLPSGWIRPITVSVLGAAAFTVTFFLFGARQNEREIMRSFVYRVRARFRR